MWQIRNGKLQFLKWCYEHIDLHAILDLDKCIELAAAFSNVEIAQLQIDSYANA